MISQLRNRFDRENYLYVDTSTVLRRHHTALANPRGEGNEVSRIAQVTKYIQKNKIERKPHDTFAGVIDVQLRDKRNDPGQKVRPNVEKSETRRGKVRKHCTIRWFGTGNFAMSQLHRTWRPQAI